MALLCSVVKELNGNAMQFVEGRYREEVMEADTDTTCSMQAEWSL